jgi:uncharacterized membrane protein YfhO
VPRAFLAGTVLIEPDKKAALDLVKQGIELDTVIVHKKVACADGTTGEAHITSYHPNRVEIEVEAASAGLLFLSDRFDPDWRVEVNEQPSQIFEAHTTFRGVCVPAGKSTVIFSYRPNSLRLGGVISLLAILGSSIVWAVNPEKRFL